MGGSLLSVLEGVPGYDGYMAAKKRQEDSQLSQLKQASVLMGLQSAMQKQAREQEMRQALAAAKTPEEQLAVATRYAGPEGIMKHADRQAQIKSTNESVRARLEQKAGDFDRSMALKYAKLDQAERMGADRNNIARYRAMLDAADKAFKQQLAQEHLRLTGAAASYNVGAAAPNIPDLNVPAAPVAPAVAPSTGTALPPNVPESDAAAFLAAKAGGSATVNRQVTPEEQARMAQMPGGQKTIPGPVTAAPMPVSAPMQDEENLDVRDLQARAAQTPAVAPAPAPAATMAMPPEIASAPKRVQDKWRLQQERKSMVGEGAMSDEAVRDLAIQSLYDSQVLAGYRRDPKVMSRIADARVKVMQDANVTSEDVVAGRAGFKADMGSLTQITKQYDAITAFENTAIRNGKILVELADKVDATGAPVVERWIRAGRKAIAGDPDVAKFHAQINLYRAEAARILTQPNLTGVLTDTARKEMEEVINNSASAKQVREVVSLLERDFGNRKVTLEQQINSIRTRMRGRVGPGGGAEAGAQSSLAVGTKGTSKSGKPMHWDGQRWVYD